MNLTDIIGKTILIGLTYYNRDNTLAERKQYFGTVIAADESLVSVRLEDGTIFGLPPDLSSTKIAPPGQYRLHSTGQTVENPDLLSTWNITR